MKSHTQNDKLKKLIQVTNKQIQKNYEHKHSATIEIKTIFGIQNNHINTQNKKNYHHSARKHELLVSINEEQILYYTCKYFILFNMITKDYQIINRDVKNCTLTQIKKFNTSQNDIKLIVCIYQTQNNLENTCLALLTINIDRERKKTDNNSRYQWKVIKLHHRNITIEDFTYQSKKNYLYFVLSQGVASDSKSLKNNFLVQGLSKSQQYLWIYDLNKDIVLLNQQIRSNTVGFFVNYISLQDSNVLYFMGKNYFRQWTVNFNEKSIKESNIRNVERVLKNKVIVDIKQMNSYNFKRQPGHLMQIVGLNPHLQRSSPILSQPSKLLLLLTQRQLLIIKSNELICIINPSQNISCLKKNKENIEKQLEHSFNQIQKIKFFFDDYEDLKRREESQDSNEKKRDGRKGGDEVVELGEESQMFTCISKCWKTQAQNLFVALANSKNKIFVYQFVDYQLKIHSYFNFHHHHHHISNSYITSIIPVQNGDILLCLDMNNRVHLVNQDDSDTQNCMNLASLWGNGQIHSGLIFGLSSPMIQNILCTVGEDGTFKLWSMKNNEKSILFESKPLQKPLGVTFHPGGRILAVNFQRQLKLFSILHKEFYEVSSIKTNYSPLQLKYSERGQFLVSNESNLLMFYESFSLKSLGYIEPADLKSKITDFRLSSNSNYVCFITEDGGCYFQSIDIGNLKGWQHIAPSHHQSQAYTAFYFDLISKQKNVTDVRKPSSLFVGATKSKYMVLYDNFGSKLLAEFPIIDCYIVNIEIYENLMFAATSKGSLRVYSWPILEEQLEMQIINFQQNQIRYKPPKYDEYQVWDQSIAITKIHKMKFSKEIIVANDRGNMCVLSFQQTKNKKVIHEEISTDREKLQSSINQILYLKKSEVEKRNKLIEKTENDILKVENETLREKISLSRKMEEQEGQASKGYQIKNSLQQSQKADYIEKEQAQIKQLKAEILQKTRIFEQLKLSITDDCQSKQLYEKQRNQQVEKQIKNIIIAHRQRIKKKIETHKQEIRNRKKHYFNKVKEIQIDFDKEIINAYEKKLKNCKIQESPTQISKQEHKNDQKKLITAMLNHNIFPCDDILQINNEKIQNLIKKLQSIERPHTATISSNQLTQPSSHKHTFSTQNLCTQLTSSKQIQRQSSKLKRSGKYQINQRAFIKKKQKQEKQQKQQKEKQRKENRHRLMQQELLNELIGQITSQENEEILVQSYRVEELLKNNNKLQKQIQLLKRKVEQIQTQDQQLQKGFYNKLQEYNASRFQNLTLHSEVLKMQNQIVQRKEVLDNKEEIVMLVYQEKEKLQNYKQMVKGSLTKLQQKKEVMRKLFLSNQTDMDSIFAQLVGDIDKMQQKKGALKNLQRKVKCSQKQLAAKQQQLNEAIFKLKQIKKYLLLQKFNDQKSQKSIFHYQQSLLNTVNFLKKRLFMQTINERKNKQLKKASLAQVLKQNQNLLQQCNQLRSEGIQLQNQISHLTKKLQEANKLISIETKLKSQKQNISQQKIQLNVIKQLFNTHLKDFYNQQNMIEENSQEVESVGQYFENDSFIEAKNLKSQDQKGQKSDNKRKGNLGPKYDQQNSQKNFKPFKLSRYIETQPNEKIESLEII